LRSRRVPRTIDRLSQLKLGVVAIVAILMVSVLVIAIGGKGLFQQRYRQDGSTTPRA
jgi:hypothetical protein